MARRLLPLVQLAVALCCCFARPAPAQTVQVTVTSEPPGNEFTVDGDGCGERPGSIYKSPQTFSWRTAAKCTVYWVSPAGSTILYRWNDGSNLNPRTFEKISENSILTATFTGAAFLAATVQCRDARQSPIACPSAPGTVFFRGLLPGATVVLTPQNDAIAMSGVFPVGSNVSINATVNDGFLFEGWITPSRPAGFSTVPQILVPVSERSVTAVFRKK